jgi:hypothetical protein
VAGINTTGNTTLRSMGGVTQSSAVAVGTLAGNLVLDGAGMQYTLDGSDSLTVGGNLTINPGATLIYTGGTLDPSGTLINGGTLQISGGNLILNGSLSNGGTVNYSGGTITISGTTISNNAGANFNLLGGAGNIDFSGAQRFDNAGTLTMDAGSSVQIGGPAGAIFNNTGTVDVNSGTLILLAHDTDAGGASGDTGAYTVAAGATLRFRDQFRDFLGGSSVNGAGNVQFDSFSGGIFTIGGSYDITGLTKITGNPSVNFNTPASFGALELSTSTGSPTLGGSGNLTVNGAFDWLGGNITGSGVFTTQGTSTLGTAALLDFSGKTWTNTGTLNLNTNTQFSGPAFNLNAGALNLAAGKAFTLNSSPFNWNAGTLAGPGQLSMNGASSFNLNGADARELNGPFLSLVDLNLNGGSLEIKSGTLNTSGATTINGGTTLTYTGGTLGVGGAFNNNGTFKMNAGTVDLAFGGTDTGAFDLAAGSTLRFTGIAPSFTGGSIQGSGNLFFDTATDLTVNIPVAANLLTLNGAGRSYSLLNSLNDIATLTGNTGSVDFRDDTGFGIAGLTTSGNTTLTVAGGTVSQNGAINADTLSLQGPGGTFDLGSQNNSVAFLTGSTGSVNFQDNGGFEISGLITSGNTTLTVAGGTVSQNGAINADTLSLQGAGGTFNLSSQNNSVAFLTGSTGTVNFQDNGGFEISGFITSGNTTLTSVGGTVSQNAAINADTLSLQGAGGTFNLGSQNNAITTLTGSTGTVSFRDDAGFDIAGLTTSGNTTLSTLGTVTQSDALNADTLDLQGVEEEGAGGTFNLGTQNNAITTLTGNTGMVNFRDDDGFDVAGFTASGDMTLISGATVTQSGALNAQDLTLSGLGMRYILDQGDLITVSNLINNGEFSGNGGKVIGNFINNGTLSPGQSPGTIAIEGDLFLSPSSVLNIELGGRQQGVTYDLIQVAGTSHLGGIMNVSLFGSFMPSFLDTFDVMTYANAIGDFAAVNSPANFPFISADRGTFYQLSSFAATLPGAASINDPVNTILPILDAVLPKREAPSGEEVIILQGFQQCRKL